MSSLDWKRLDSRYIVRDEWLTLRADSYQLPDERVIEPVYVIEYRDWVNVVALTPAQEVVLVRQFRPGLGQIVLEFPGGTTDPGETCPLDAARRELLEETGYAGDDFAALGAIAPNPASHTNMMHCFLARNVEWVCEPDPDEAEHLEVVLLPLDELIRMAQRGEILQAMHLSALFFALGKLGRIA